MYPPWYHWLFCNSLSFELTLFFIHCICRAGEMSFGNNIPNSCVECSTSLKVQAHARPITHAHTHTHMCSVMSSESDGAPSCRLKKRCLFHLRQITMSPGLDSNGLSLWNGIPPHALQIYLLFYLPGQAHGKIIPNTCRALSGTLE